MNNNNITLLFFIFTLFISSIYAYSVVGNKIYDPNGKETLLRGMVRPSMEWNPEGEQLSLNDYTRMKAWGTNVVRICLNQDHWFNDAKGYKARIQQQVTWIKSLGMGVIFDLHWNNGGQQNMADRRSINFWSEFATAWKTDSSVMFELYNEPHDVSWSVWRNGDSSFAGMQEMYNAVRAAGADNVVIICGLNWAFDLSGISSGYAITGSNIAYASHPYDFGGKQSGDWDRAFGNLAATYPVILTEFGQYCAQNTYVSQLLAYAQTKGLHWTAWAWYVQGCDFPSVIADWNGNPLGIVGNLVQQYLGGRTPTPPTTGPVIPATTALNVYTDSLQNGFIDYSWSTSFSLSDSAHVHSGSSAIKFKTQAYEAIYFHLPSNFFSLGSYSTLRFYVYTTVSIFANNFNILLYDASELKAGVPVTFPVSTVAGAWVVITVPVTAFGAPLNTLVSGIAIQGNVASTVGDVWVDDIAFLPGGDAGTVAPTQPATVKPTQPATVAPTQPATVKPTQPATVAPTQPATVKPTQSATIAPTQPATVKPTQSATVAPTQPATVKPTQPATVAPTVKPTVKPTSPPSTSGCDASNVVVAQIGGSPWESGGSTITQFQITISSTCVGKSLKGLTFTVTNWNPVGFWGGEVSGTTFTVPSWVSISPSSPYSFGYQNRGGVATFAVGSYTFE